MDDSGRYVGVAVGDVNGDGTNDLIFGAGPGGGPRVLVLSGKTLLDQGSAAALAAPIANFFAGDTTNRGGVRVAVKNLDNDAFADIVTGAGQGGGSGVATYLGKDLTAGNDAENTAFDAFTGAAASASLPIPRFVNTAIPVPLFNTNACATIASTTTTLSASQFGTSSQ